ncbi:hypothetical protein GCM10027082_38500 [Comamonas humi]
METKVMDVFKRYAIGSAALFFSLGSLAALPQTGMWGINSELNGKPGRGIQIDRQGGETIIASYYGYRVDGSAVFYQAVGQIKDGSIVTADLVEYKNGTALAGNIRTGEVAEIIGQVRFEFDTPSSGYVTLPGETRKSFSPIIYEDKRAQLNHSFRVASTQMLSQANAGFGMQNYQINVQGDAVKIRLGTPSFTCTFNGDLVRTGATFSIVADGGCVASGGISTAKKRYTDIQVDESGRLSMKVRSMHVDGGDSLADAIDGDFFGVCVNSIENIKDNTTSVEACIPEK